MGSPENPTSGLETRHYSSLPFTGLSTASEYPIGQTDNAGRVLDVFAEDVFASVMERIRSADPGRGRARFEIETDQGSTIRVRLTVDANIVSARIDAPTEEVRQLLAGHARELNQRLEAEGLIPNDIEFCLAGGRDETAGQEPQPRVRRAFQSAVLDKEVDSLTMVETEACAFESWA
jgi:hypothetical protein